MASERTALFQVKNIPEQAFNDFKKYCVRQGKSMNKVFNEMMAEHVSTAPKKIKANQDWPDY